ncbi:MFS transporter [Rheinheimera sp.]|uniref:MFS transporter n=1 Tax=Rheinheimera sp. TaxID=1869214 RepID=UPI00307DA045
MTPTSAPTALPTGPKLALGFGFLSTFFASQSVAVLAIPYYQMTLGLDPFLLALALTLPLLLGSLLGPWVGHLSDHSQSRFGRRKPYILVGSWASCISFGLIWMVPAGWADWAQLLYFVLCSLCFYVCATLVAVPMTCLAYEMSPDYHQRTEIMGFTSYFLKLGSLLYQWLFPLAQLSLFGSVFFGIQVVGWGVGILLLGVLGTIAALGSQEKVRVSAAPIPRPSLLTSLKTLSGNTGLKVLLGLTLLQMAGGAAVASLDYYLLVYAVSAGSIEQGAVLKGWLSMAFAALGILSIPLLASLARRVGKKTALLWVYWLTLAGGVAKWFIYTPQGVYWLWLDALLCTASWTAMTMLIPSMIVDLSDEDELAQGQRRDGAFAAVHGWVTHLSAALALLATGLCLNLIQFDAHLGAAQSPQTLDWMRAILSGGTVLFALLSLWLLRHYQLDAAQCRKNREQLQLRQRQQTGTIAAETAGAE